MSAVSRAKNAASHKGMIPVNKGKHLSPEIKEKISSSLKGRPFSLEHRKKLSETGKGRVASEEARKNMSIAQQKRIWKPSTEHAAALLAANKGKPKTIGWRAEMSRAMSGPGNHEWRGGISFEPYCPKFNENLKKRIRAFFEYRCIMCGKHENEQKRKLSCHHVEYNKQSCCDGKPVQFAATCGKCHSKTNHNRTEWEVVLHRIIEEIYGGRSYFTKEEWNALGDGDDNKPA